MKFIHTVAWLILAATAPTLSPQSVSAAATSAQESATKINVSGRQRMLTQRMAAAACFMAIKVDVDGQAEVLQDARDLYGRSLDGLKNGNAKLGLLPESDSTVLKELSLGDALWQDFSGNVDVALTGDPAAAIVQMELSTPILEQSDRIVKAFVDSRGSTADLTAKMAQTIDLAGRQRMLSQRIAKSACAMQGAKFPRTAAAELTVAKREFGEALAALEAGSATVVAPPSTAIADQLEIVRGLWTDLDAPLQEILDGTLLSVDEMSAVAAQTTKLLQEMNKVVGMYEASS